MAENKQQINPMQWLTSSIPSSVAITKTWQRQYFKYQDVIVVLDDDPTGTQSVHDVDVYTDWEEGTLQQAFSSGAKMFYILTNSRSFSAAKTTVVHQEIARHIAKVAKARHESFLLISRGDSTLRGHFPLETDVLKATLEASLLVTYDGLVLCPAFFDGGRYTIGNVHYLMQHKQLIPVGKTEFAQDKTFGFHASNLIDYVIEKSHGQYQRNQCVTIDLVDLRALNYEKITTQLMAVHDFQPIIVNAATQADLQVFCLCLIKARMQGKKFICRSAADLPRVLGNVQPMPWLTKAKVVDANNSHGGLIVVGSHVALSTMQLEALRQAKPELLYLEFTFDEFITTNSFANTIARTLTAVTKAIAAGQTAVVYTDRHTLAPADYSKEAQLAMSVAISEALTTVVQQLTVRPRYLIAKGGITSSDIATHGLGVKVARVLGQITKGIPVWQTQAESRFPGLAYLIFPGNIGDVETLKMIVTTLEGK